MEKLVSLVQEKTGLSEEHSRDAVNVVIAYLKERLPDPIADQVDNYLGDEAEDDGDDSVMDVVKGLF